MRYSVVSFSFLSFWPVSCFFLLTSFYTILLSLLLSLFLLLFLSLSLFLNLMILTFAAFYSLDGVPAAAQFQKIYTHTAVDLYEWHGISMRCHSTSS